MSGRKPVGAFSGSWRRGTSEASRGCAGVASRQRPNQRPSRFAKTSGDLGVARECVSPAVVAFDDGGRETPVRHGAHIVRMPAIDADLTRDRFRPSHKNPSQDRGWLGMSRMRRVGSVRHGGCRGKSDAKACIAAVTISANFREGTTGR